MPMVVLVGLTAEAGGDLPSRLPGVEVVRLPESEAALEAGLIESPPDLLVIDDGFHNGRGVEWLAEYRAQAVSAGQAESRTGAPKIIYCLAAGADGRLVRRLIVELGVNEVLFHPVEEAALAQCAAGLLGMTLSEPAGLAGATGNDEELRHQLGGVWRSASGRMFERLAVLEEAARALAEGRLGGDLRRQAECEAHKLAGSLGTFGRAAGSRFARELEQSLPALGPSDDARVRRFFELVAALRLELERASAALHSSVPPPAAPRFRAALLVCGDSELAARLREEAAARDWNWEVAPDVASARAALAGPEPASPSTVLIDLETAAGSEDTLQFLSELGERRPQVPAVVLTSRAALADRVEVARRGGRGFFPKNLPPAEVVDAAIGLLNRVQPARATVLAVDDDPVVLDALQALLVPQGIRFIGLSDPLRFWEALEGSSPDLVVLDVEMPSVNGLELCRVLRSDPRRAAIPVIFLTAHSDPATVHRVFGSGADDFVAKPIAGPELATRIANRLERTRLLRHLAETDPVTGLANRLASTRALQDFLSLANRHGQPMGFAALEVDRLKSLNEVYGAAAGDEALRWLGERLRCQFRTEEIKARWGGNDFVVGFYGLDRQGSLRRLEEVVRALGADRIAAGDGRELRLTLSAGVAAYPEDAGDLEGLRQAAVEGRRRAAAAGGNRVLPGNPAAAAGGVQRADVAVVTADEAVASLLVNAFESCGYRARALCNGLVAARALSGPDRSLRVRALVLDLDLPGLDGLTLLRQLASDGVLHDAATILLTSPSVGREAVTALELGAEDQVAKPFDVPVLVERVRQVLESRPPSRRAD